MSISQTTAGFNHPMSFVVYRLMNTHVTLQLKGEKKTY